MLKEIKISVIIPVYNAEPYLRRCVDSVLAQKEEGLEILLVDDGSSDASGRICREYEERFAFVRAIFQENRGVSAARNAGLKEAKGEWIHLIDADDWIDPGFYAALIPPAEKTGADVIFCGWNIAVPEKDTFRYIAQSDKAPLGEGTREDIYREMLIQCGIAGGMRGYGNYVWNKLFCRTSCRVSFDETVSVAEDGLFLVEAAKGWNKVWMDPAPRYHYFKNPSGATGGAEKYAASRLDSQKSHLKMLEILKKDDLTFYELHRKTCLGFFWLTIKNRPQDCSAFYVQQTLKNMAAINDGVLPEEAAGEILTLLQKEKKTRDTLPEKLLRKGKKLLGI